MCKKIIALALIGVTFFCIIFYEDLSTGGEFKNCYQDFIAYEKSGKDWWANTDYVPDMAWGQALNVWEAYISIYETTGDIQWLDKIVVQIDAALEKRDFCTGKEDYLGNSLRSWSSAVESNNTEVGYYEPTCVGLIIHPIFRFVEVVKENRIEKYYDKAEVFFEAGIDALAVFDSDIIKNMNIKTNIKLNQCYDLWEEEKINTDIVEGFYTGHLYYETDKEKYFNYASRNMLPYNQSLAIAQSFPVLYRLTGDQLWKDKAEKSWNWFESGIQKDSDNIYWWYYSKYSKWYNSKDKLLMQEIPPPDTYMEYYYEDYAGHYSIDLMFIIEAHKIKIISDYELLKVSENKKEYGLIGNKWGAVMNRLESKNDRANLKAAQYYDYFAITLDDKQYIELVYPKLKKELNWQNNKGVTADMSTKNNGTCLRLLAATCAAEKWLGNYKEVY